MPVDITSPKIAIPSTLFLLLSPGMALKTDGRALSVDISASLKAMKTDHMSVFFHALVFLAVYAVIAKLMGLVLTRTDLLVTTVLFMALSPGILLTIPPGSGGFFMSGTTSRPSMLVHTIVFALVFAFLRKQFPQFY